MPRTYTTEEAGDVASRAGIEIPADVQLRAVAAQEQARRNFDTRLKIARQGESGSEKFNREFSIKYQAILNFLNGAGDVMTSFTQTAAVTVAIPVALFLLLVVEVQRVYHGIMVFEPVEDVAIFGAVAFLLASLILKFTIFKIEEKEHKRYLDTGGAEGYKPQSRSRFSFVLLQNALDYVFKRDQWVALPLSPAADKIAALRLVKLAIVALATSGSMKVILAATPGTWGEGLKTIAEGSSLGNMSMWVSVLLFSLTSLSMMQHLVEEVARASTDVQARLRSIRNADAEALDESINRAGGQVIMAYVNAEKSRLKEEAERVARLQDPADPEVVSTVSGVSGNVQKQPKQAKPRPDSPEMIKAKEWLLANPDRAREKNRDLAPVIGVSASTVYRAQIALGLVGAAVNEDTQAAPAVAPEPDLEQIEASAAVQS